MNKIIEELEKEFEKENYKGNDPYDLLEKLHNNNRLMNYLLNSLTELFPNTLLKILKVDKKINSKALGLILQGLAERYVFEKKTTILKKCEKIIDLIKKENSYPENSRYAGFGYPFHWWSKGKDIGRNVPNVAATIQVALGLIKYFRITKNKEIKKMLEKIALFFLEEINYTKTKNGLQASYTPYDKKEVYNINIQIAYFFYLITKETQIITKNINKISTTRKKLIEQTISKIREDGSIPYAKESATVDHYHTGIILEFLYKMEENKRKEVKKLKKFYLKELFNQDECFLSTTGSMPLDIHSYAQAILTLDAIGEKNKIKPIIDYAINNFYEKGHFYYRIYKNPFKKKYHFRPRHQIIKTFIFSLIRPKIKVNYLRWADAWMYYALKKVRSDEK